MTATGTAALDFFFTRKKATALTTTSAHKIQAQAGREIRFSQKIENHINIQLLLTAFHEKTRKLCCGKRERMHLIRAPLPFVGMIQTGSKGWAKTPLSAFWLPQRYYKYF